VDEKGVEAQILHGCLPRQPKESVAYPQLFSKDRLLPEGFPWGGREGKSFPWRRFSILVHSDWVGRYF
jgi:hypothetical protein